MVGNQTFYERALAELDSFSDKAVAVLPERPCHEMLNYVAHMFSVLN